MKAFGSKTPHFEAQTVAHKDHAASYTSSTSGFIHQSQVTVSFLLSSATTMVRLVSILVILSLKASYINITQAPPDAFLSQQMGDQGKK